MTSIDSVILNVTERRCRRFQVLTGRTNVWLGLQLTNLSIIVCFVWAAALTFPCSARIDRTAELRANQDFSETTDADVRALLDEREKPYAFGDSNRVRRNLR